MSLIFTEFVLWWKFILFAMFLHKSDIWGNFGSWDMGQNVLIQSDCSIFKSTISPKQKNPDLLHVDTNSRKWKIFWVGIVRNGCGWSVHGTLKLAVSQKWIDGMDWFLACWYKFKKVEGYFNDFWLGQVKNGFGQFMRPLNLLNEFMDWADFLHADCDAIIFD